MSTRQMKEQKTLLQDGPDAIDLQSKDFETCKKITAVIVARDILFSFPKETILLKNE